MRHLEQDRPLSVRVPQSIHNKMQYVADQHYTDLSSTVRSALREYLTKHDNLFTEEFMNANAHHSVARF